MAFDHTSFNHFKDFTVFDFETSGLNPQVDQIIEASVIRVRNGDPVMTFNALVKLREGIVLNPKITELTGHTVYDLEGGIDEETLAHVLAGMMPDEELLIAHNALFDLSFLNQLFERQGYTSVTNPFIDTCTIARSREPYPHKLTDVCKRNGIELSDAHSAEADNTALMEVVLKYNRDASIHEWVNVAGYRPKYGEPTWYPDHAVLKKQGAEIVQHGAKKAPLRPGSIKSPTVSPRTKKVPSKAETLSDEDMPSALLPKWAKERIDEFIERGEVIIEIHAHEDEADSIIEYMKSLPGVREQDITTTPEDVTGVMITLDLLPY